MVRESTQHEAEDRRQRDLAEARNTADQLVYSIEKSLGALGDRVPAAEKAQVDGLVRELKTAMESDDAGRIRSLTEQLTQASHAFSQQLYQAQQQTQPDAGYGPPGGDAQGYADDDIVDGDFTEV